MSLARIYEPTDPVDLARVRTLLDASGVPFFVEGGEYVARRVTGQATEPEMDTFFALKDTRF